MEKGKKWYQSPGNWVFLIACVILVPVLIMNLYIMFQAKTNADEVPSVFGIKPFMVLSGSMETEIKKGDLIITKVVDPTTLGVDDVIAFRDEEGTVTTHRIIDTVEKNGEKFFITKGDNNSSQDQNLVELSDVEGIYITRIPGIGSMMKSLSEPTTIMIIGLGITVIFVISFSISAKKQREMERLEFLEYKRMKEQEEKEQQQEKKEFQKYNHPRERQPQYNEERDRHHNRETRNSYNSNKQNNGYRKERYQSSNNERQNNYRKDKHNSYNKNRQHPYNSKNNNQNGNKSNKA